MFIIGLILNLVSLYHLVQKVLRKQSRNKSRMTILLINLAIADLMVMYHIENRIVQMFVNVCYH